MESLKSDSIKKLHEAMWGYIREWQVDPTGPWWEGDLSLDIGRALVETFGCKESIEIDNAPSFLQAWPPVCFRRLGINNYFGRRKEQGLTGETTRGGRYPDYFYRKAGTDDDDCDWKVELKLWSVDGNCSLEKQVQGAIKGFNADASKWKDKETYPFIFLAVNIPDRFERARKARHTYKPEDFVQKLMYEVSHSADFRALNGTETESSS